MIKPLPSLKTLVLLPGTRCEDGPSQTTAIKLKLVAMSVLQASPSLENVIVSIGFRPPKDKSLKDLRWPWRWPLVYLWLTKLTRPILNPPCIVVWKHFNTCGSPKMGDFCDLVDFHNGKM